MTSRNPTLLAIAILALPWTAWAQPVAAPTVVRERVVAPVRAIALAYQRGGTTQSETITRTVNIGANGELNLSNLSGNIIVSRGGGNTVTIEIVKTARAATAAEAQEALKLVTVEILVRGGRAEVTTRYPGSRGDRRNLNVSTAYTVTAPAGTRVIVRSISGSIRVTDIEGELSLETTSGNVTATGAARLASAKSVSGNVQVSDIRTDTSVEASSMSGNVTLRNVEARRLALNSISGNVTVEDASCGRVEAQTMSGTVVYGGTLMPKGRYDLKSHSGDVRLRLDGRTGFELDARTFSGAIRSDLPLTTRAGDTVRGPGARGRAFRGTFGDGSAVINASTFSGSVVIGESKK
jgi:hypothetical protein